VTVGVAKAFGSEGTIDLDVTDAGARVLLDGTEVARGPIRKSVAAAVGPHRVLVDLEGHATWDSAVNVQPRTVTMVSPRLVPLVGGGGARPAGDRSRWTYLAATGTLGPNDLRYVILPGAGVGYDLRLGHWLAPSWAAEVAFSQKANDIVAVSSATLSGSAGALWSPAIARWFGIAALLGYARTQYKAKQPPDQSGASTSWTGSAELRADVPSMGGLAFEAALGGTVLSNHYDADALGLLTGTSGALPSVKPSDIKPPSSWSYGIYARAGLRVAF
jgi:hypothetical protein